MQRFKHTFKNDNLVHMTTLLQKQQFKKNKFFLNPKQKKNNINNTKHMCPTLFTK